MRCYYSFSRLIDQRRVGSSITNK